MCNTLTVAWIFGCLETISYLGLTTYFVLCLTYLRSTVDWDLKNEIDIFEINESGIDQETNFIIWIVLGSIGMICSFMLVIGLSKVCLYMHYQRLITLIIKTITVIIQTNRCAFP